jgi:hypothetical protein
MNYRITSDGVQFRIEALVNVYKYRFLLWRKENGTEWKPVDEEGYVCHNSESETTFPKLYPTKLMALNALRRFNKRHAWRPIEEASVNQATG